MKNILENNKLFSEFMGGLYNNQSRLSLQSNEIWLPHHGVCNYKSDRGKSLKYHSDWSWLMEVVEKIESLGYVFEIKITWCRIKQRENGNVIVLRWEDDKTKIEAVYNACLEFIKWYNENKSK